jgi:hypothetical protein
MRVVLPGLPDALRHIDVSDSQGYGIWAPGGTGPAATWSQALLAINRETVRVPGWRAALETSPVGARPFDQAYARRGHETRPDHLPLGNLAQPDADQLVGLRPARAWRVHA